MFLDRHSKSGVYTNASCSLSAVGDACLRFFGLRWPTSAVRFLLSASMSGCCGCVEAADRLDKTWGMTASTAGQYSQRLRRRRHRWLHQPWRPDVAAAWGWRRSHWLSYIHTHRVATMNESNRQKEPVLWCTPSVYFRFASCRHLACLLYITCLSFMHSAQYQYSRLNPKDLFNAIHSLLKLLQLDTI